MRTKMTKENEPIGFTRDQMIQMLKILETNNNLVIDINEAHHDNNVRYMKLEEQLFYEKWKNRYLVRRIKHLAKLMGDPNIAVTEEELDEQIKRSEN